MADWCIECREIKSIDAMMEADEDGQQIAAVL